MRKTALAAFLLFLAAAPATALAEVRTVTLAVSGMT